jgi:hypothetical protein
MSRGTTALQHKGDFIMKFVRSIAAAALLSALTTTPLFAQAAISELGAFQAGHPYLDVLNGRTPTRAYWLQQNPRELQAIQQRESGVYPQPASRHRR